MTEQAAHQAEEHVAHPTVGLYTKVIVFLAVITAIEIVIILPDVKEYYRTSLPWFTGMVIPLLMLLSAIKFLGVVGFFMHLRQDRGAPRLVFFGPLILALLLVLVLMVLFGTLL